MPRRAHLHPVSPDHAIEARRRWRRISVQPRCTIVATICAVVLTLGASAPTAHADGDPASDYLVARQVFVTSQQVAPAPPQRALLGTVGAANRAGFKIRVAIISTDYDLGSITALWRKPTIYARFLGLELSSIYRGRLLVVMPNGFGFNWPQHSSRPEYEQLAKVPIKPDEAGLLTAAQTAVRSLATADGVTVRLAATPSPTGTARPRARGGLGVWLIVAALAVLAILAAGLLVLHRRQRAARRKAPRTRTVKTGSTRWTQRGWAVPAFTILCGMAGGGAVLAFKGLGDGSAATSTQEGSVVTPPPFSWPAGRRSAPGFVLRDQEGHPVSVAAYRGRPVIVTFIDPLCRNLCPLEAKVLNDVVARAPAAERPEILAVSVDVYANARADLLQDVRKWQLVPQWRWAVGRPTQLAAVWHRYHIGVNVTTKRIAGNTINYITHTEAAYIIDSTGHERALFLWPFYPQDVERTLRHLT
jgi:cytochrome oxidase Cu insertion factor (SCO1/SenC/PrrC family)